MSVAVMSDLDVLRSLAVNIEINFPEKYVLLSGSRARGDFGDESDYDLLFWNVEKEAIDKYIKDALEANIQAEYHCYYSGNLCYNVFGKEEVDGKFALLDAVAITGKEFNESLSQYREQLVRDPRLSSVQTGSIEMKALKFMNNVQLLTNSKVVRHGICALIRLIYLSNEYENSAYLVDNVARWKFCVQNNPDWASYDGFVTDVLLNRLRVMNCTKLTLDEHLAVCILFYKAKPLSA
jgi:predicted nucleotidyltransferase